MNRYKQLYIYFSSYFINAAFSFLILSLLTRYIKAPEDYGIISLYSSFLIFLTPFVSGGISYPVSVEYFKQPKDRYANYFTDANAIPVVSVVVFTGLCILFQYPLSRIIKVPVAWIWIMPLTAWLIMLCESLATMTRNRNRPYQFAAFSIGKNVSEISLTLLFVLGFHLTWQGRLASAATTPLFFGILSIVLFYRWGLIADKVNWQNTRRIFFLAFPFIFERLAVFVLGYSDRYFIDRFDPNRLREVGLYGLGSQLANVIYLVISSMNSAYHPYLFKKLSEGFKGKIHKTTMLYIGGCAVSVIGLFLVIPLIFHFFIGKNYQEAKPYAYILCSGYLMWGVYNAFVGYLVYLGKNRQILFISVVGMVASLLLNTIMVINFGARGAAVTSGITYSVMALSCYLLVKKYFLRRNESPAVQTQ